LFLFLEIISFYLIINYNKSQKEIWAHSSNIFTGSIYEKVEGVQDFFELKAENDSLLVENAKLLETIINFRVTTKESAFETFEAEDSLINYSVIPARVCSKTINLRNNFLTLCKGEQDGIKIGMGVFAKEGIVGIIKSVSDNFATVLMILNSQSRISGSINSKKYHGNLVWDSENPMKLNLLDVPKHADIQIGDSISTSGYSVSFPPDIYIGKISDYTLGGGSNSYNIEVDLNHDLSKLEYVYVIAFDKSEEKQVLIEESDE